MNSPTTASSAELPAELDLYADADRRALTFATGIGSRPVFPDVAARNGLARFNEPIPLRGKSAMETIELLDAAGSPAAVAFNDPRYYGYVVGATLPAAAAAERIALAWDQAASDSSAAPAPAAIEAVAARWCLEVLDLPRTAGVGFTTGASTSNLIAFATARRVLLERLGWNLDLRGLRNSPQLRVVVSDAHHVTVGKALRILGFGADDIVRAPVDEHGRIRPELLPPIDAQTLLVLQAGEVHTGESDPFTEILPLASDAGAWTHVDGAFGLWARASDNHRHLVAGIEAADSWTVDAHKWLNTPYDNGMVICRDVAALGRAMTSDADYTTQSAGAQRNLTLEFSRRARGIAVWAALRTLGRDGVADLVDSRIALAQRAAEGLTRAGFNVLNRVYLNQVLLDASTAENARRISTAVQDSGRAWLGPSTWRGKPAIRVSVTSWRTTERHIDELITLLAEIRDA
ncbi:pyridoxal phosphate-dependent decarboxylase family protein [Jatrophihabitans telluris]